jgi:hypothetical protein
MASKPALHEAVRALSTLRRGHVREAAFRLYSTAEHLCGADADAVLVVSALSIMLNAQYEHTLEGRDRAEGRAEQVVARLVKRLREEAPCDESSQS